jgi:hypothetical protein
MVMCGTGTLLLGEVVKTSSPREKEAGRCYDVDCVGLYRANPRLVLLSCGRLKNDIDALRR